MTNQTPPMEQNQNKNQDQNQTSVQNDLRDRIVKGLTKNWGTKLLALVIAIVLWAGLISQDPSLTREKTFNGVSISITGEDTMKRNGFIVVNDLESKLDNAFLRVEVPQLQYNTVTSSPFNARVDLSRIKTTGRQTINISTTNTSIYGSVKEIEPASVEVVVEEYITRYRIPVMISIVGKVPDGYYAATPSVDPPMIAVSGPRSLVEQVARAEAVLDLSVLPAREGSVRTALPIVLQSADGKPINSSLLEATSESVLLDSVVVDQKLYTQKTMLLADIAVISGEPANGYEIKSVTITPSSVIAAGYSASLDALDRLYASTSVSVEGASESFTQRVSIRKPSELTYLSAESMTVAVEIGPVISEKAFERQKVSVVNLDEGMQATMLTNRADVIVRGPMLWLEGLRSGDLALSVDASGLPAGIYELPVLCSVSGGTDQEYATEVIPEFIQVEIEEK